MVVSSISRALKGLIALGLFTLAWTATASNAVAQTSGFVYTSTNASSGNQVLGWSRGAGGILTPLPGSPFSTQGTGNDNNIPAQGTVVFGPGYKFLYVANPGSNDVTAFSVARNGNLTFVNRVTTAINGGTLPKSVSVSPDGKYLYAVNGLHSNIVGFTINATTGALTSIANSSRSLSSGTFVEPCQIGFSPNGKFIVVTEILTSKIDTWGFNSSTGLPTTVAKVQNSAGPQPFGFSFDKAGRLVVSEMTASTVSTYSIAPNGTLTLISNQVPDNGSQACWVAITNNKSFPQQYALISDTASRTLSVYGLNPDGSVTLLHSLIPTPLSPTDEALSIDNSFMYVRDGNATELSVWSISSDGTPTQIDPPVTGLPTNGLGMAAR